MNKALPIVIVLLLLFLAQGTTSAQKGWWKFDNAANLTASEPGRGPNLILVGSHSATAGPSGSNGAVKIGVGSYYRLNHGIAPNGGGTKVNRFSLMFDFKIPASAWHCFFQLDSLPNTSDGDYFIKPTGEIGTSGAGYTTFLTALNTWYRLIITVDNGNFMRAYINGALVKEHTMYAIDTRYSLLSSMLLFADDDGDDGEIDIAEAAIWDYPLSAAEVTAYGGVGSTLPVELTSFSASVSGQTIRLDWKTATEQNNRGFEIQRKGQSSEWAAIGFVAGNGNSTEFHSYSFTDNNSVPGIYSYRLKQVDLNGTYEYSSIVEVDIAPADFAIIGNYPNPFNPSTQIDYSLPENAFVSLRIYNITGEQVAELASGYKPAGKYTVTFNALSQGSTLPGGIYFAELRANQKVSRIKMMLLK